jgi:diguanylate cyclase
MAVGRDNADAPIADLPVWRGLRRMLGYSIILLLPILGLGALLSQMSRAEADRNAIASAVAQAHIVARSGIEPQLQGHSLVEGLRPTERTGVAAASNALLRSGVALQLRLRDSDGRVVFDAEFPGQDVGETNLEDGVVRASRGEIVSLRTTVGADIIGGRQTDTTPAIELYMPLYSSVDDAKAFGVLGVLEVHVPFSQISAARNASQHRIYFALLGALLALWVVLATIVWSVTRRIQRQSDAHRHLALHDPLTGLPNRTLFADRVGQAIAAARREGRDVSVAIVDLDRFKEVNDTLGHANGDELLRTVANRIRLSLRPADTVARLGGDEFGLVLPGVSGDAARNVLQRIQAALGEEISIEGVPVAPEASIGWCEWPHQADTLDSLQRNADLALYSAKEGNSEIVRYDDHMLHADPTRVALVAELRRAINGSELELHYQPKIDMKSHSTIGFEALVRWRHPHRGLVPPDEFIPVAESTGLIAPLTRWVLETALRQVAAWGDATGEMSIAINISARNLRDPDLTEWIIGQLAEHRIRPSRLILEITETAVTTDQTRAALHVAQLQAAGICVSLDDFGQGYTSLSQLARLGIGELKIDRGFVQAMQNSTKDHAIVASVIALGHQLGLRVVAEGVENVGVLETLQGLGCDFAQGFHIAKPLTAGTIPSYLANRAEDNRAEDNRAEDARAITDLESARS